MKIQGETAVLEVAADCPVEAKHLVAANVLVHNGSGSRPPLIMIRTSSRAGKYILNLADHVGPDQPIYSIAPPEFDQLDRYPQNPSQWLDFIEKRIRDLQLSGPLSLGGFSFGGVLAFGTAERLRAQGECVRRILLLDARIPQDRGAEKAAYKEKGATGNRATHWLKNAKRHVVEFYQTQDLSDARQYARRRILGRPPAHASKESLAFETLHEPGPQDWGDDAEIPPQKTVVTSRGTRMSYLKRTVQICYVKYQRQSTAIPVTVLYTKDSCKRQKDDPSLGWEPYLEGEHQFIEVAGTHITLFNPPKDKKLALQIAEVLDRS